MDTNEHEYQVIDSGIDDSQFGELAIEEQGPAWLEMRQIVGCAMEVLNELGHGLHEKPYENALVVEFNVRGIPYVQQPRYEALYKGVPVGVFVPDLVVLDKVIVDTKVVDRLGSLECGQMLNYLKITGLNAGVVLNFQRPRLEWKRVVL